MQAASKIGCNVSKLCQESFRDNVQGTLKVMEWALTNKVKVVYAGSSSKHHNPADSPYAMYKYLGEEICKLYKIDAYDIEDEFLNRGGINFNQILY